jgi:hypothetical protein
MHHQQVCSVGSVFLQPFPEWLQGFTYCPCTRNKPRQGFRSEQLAFIKQDWQVLPHTCQSIFHIYMGRTRMSRDVRYFVLGWVCVLVGMVPWAVLLADSSGAVFGMLCVVGQIAGACVGFWLIYKAHTWREPEPKKERPNNEKWS